MEDRWRWMLLTAIAPVAWGSVYFVTRQWLPADIPLTGAALRAIPAGLILLLIARRRPRGAWWWKSAVLGTLNTGAFFALIYVAAQLLPTSVASTVMAASPIAMMLIAWTLLGRRPALLPLIGAALGIVGVTLMLGGGVSPSRCPGCSPRSGRCSCHRRGTCSHSAGRGRPTERGFRWRCCR